MPRGGKRPGAGRPKGSKSTVRKPDHLRSKQVSIRLPAWLAEQGVSVVVASGMGSRAQDLFSQHSIKVAVNVLETDPEKAVLSYLSGTLEVGDDVCDH